MYSSHLYRGENSPAGLSIGDVVLTPKSSSNLTAATSSALHLQFGALSHVSRATLEMAASAAPALDAAAAAGRMAFSRGQDEHWGDSTIVVSSTRTDTSADVEIEDRNKTIGSGQQGATVCADSSAVSKGKTGEQKVLQTLSGSFLILHFDGVGGCSSGGGGCHRRRSCRRYCHHSRRRCNCRRIHRCRRRRHRSRRCIRRCTRRRRCHCCRRRLRCRRRFVSATAAETTVATVTSTAVDAAADAAAAAMAATTAAAAVVASSLTVMTVTTTETAAMATAAPAALVM
ncbi:uncharacterized protein LOC141826965 [Curcuma longa]|uniref:uncharacterized protein LOC141826965 n=1 Tax=Curcuma longa TaxID=136217 RepID=UPI003D9E410C